MADTKNQIALGIDLGTSNCCIAIYEAGKAKVLPDERGNHYTPSYLTILPNGKFLVGNLAKVQAISNPFQTAYAVKRLIGRRIDDPEVQKMKERVGYSIIEGANRSACVKLGEQVLTPVEISTAFLRAMKDIAQHHLEREITDVIITVPAYFSEAQRRATKEAGEKAGLNVLRLINEPTSAALAYGFNKNINRRVAIFDLGGGTFDISVLEINGGIFDVLGTAGDTFLGGNDFDNRLVDLVLEDFKKKHNLDLRTDKMALQRVKDACEHAKCELSASETARVNLPFIASGAEGSINLNFEVTRQGFEDITKDLVQRCIGICEQVLKDCNLKPEQVQDIVMVGGQSRMPMVQRAVQDFFKKPPVKGVHPDEAVALGAAIQAGVLESQDKKVLLLDITPMTLGIKSAGDMFTAMIPKATKIPVSVSHIFTTTQDNQSRVKITVLQGDNKRAFQNVLLGEFILEGIRSAPRLEPKIQVSFRIDTDGILNVKAVDLDTKQTQQITIRNYVGTTEGAAPDVAPVADAEECLDVVAKE